MSEVDGSKSTGLYAYEHETIAVWNQAIELAAKLASEYDERFSSKSLVEEIRELKK